MLSPGLLEEPTLSSSYTLGEAASQARSLTFTIRPDVRQTTLPPRGLLHPWSVRMPR
jgi:hypothetical protein